MADLHVPINRDQGGIAGQIAAEIRASIRHGRLAPGTRLPASRDLAADLQVSRGVVVEAYEQLVAEGFLISRVGAGTQVAPTSARSAMDVVPASGPVYSPHYGHRPTSPDLGCFPRERWLASVRHVLTTMPSDVFDYGDPGGVPELRDELAGYLRRVRAADVRADNLVIVGGVAQGISLAVQVLTQRSRRLRLAVEDPNSHRQVPLLLRAGAELVPVPVDDQGLVVTELRARGADAVLITPAHQYPTGVVLSPARRAALMEWAAETGGVVLEDDYDAEFRFDRDPVGCLQGLAPARVILSGSVSKALAPGLRLGWVAAPAELAESMRQARGELDLGSPVIDQYALAHFLRTGGYDKHLRRMRREYRRRRDALVKAVAEHLPEVRVRGIAAGLHAYLDLPPGSDEDAFVRPARELGLAADPVGPTRLTPGPPGVVVGFARLPAHRAAEVIQGLKVRMSGQNID
ncbi:PLP-dependent aminotransferase family protein [Nonomuraea sp. CA-143628]|uniref:MocR-like pyridoxine biosynthesis transcription factor PdxR n=1 Tax=Nonomuraea sp. CA-143628 TaxID=3239997 RepID=UPI003D8A03E3